MTQDTGIHSEARADWIEPAIARRVFRIGRVPHRWFHHLLLLSGGEAQISAEERAPWISGPALAFFPPTEGETLTFAAGAHGHLVGVSPEIFAEASGDHAESSSLRTFAASRSLSIIGDGETHRALVPLFSGFMAEMAREGQASRMVIAAYLRLILMNAWRLSGGMRSETDGQTGTGALLQRFRQSVEINFRRHRTIAAYAAELNISTDRLHAICQRALARSPIELVHDRLTQEAKLRLERSARSVQEISDSLGFRDPANFSHFFKRKTGISPAKYRSLAQQSPGTTTVPLAASYHDWP